MPYLAATRGGMRGVGGKKNPSSEQGKERNKPICARHRALNKHMGKVIMFILIENIYIRRGGDFRGYLNISIFYRNTN